MVTSEGNQPLAAPGSGTATASKAWIRNAITMSSAPTSTFAWTISAHSGTQDGGASSRSSSSSSSSTGGVSACAGGPNAAKPTTAAAAAAVAPRFDAGQANGQRQARPSRSNAKNAASRPSAAAASTRSTLVSQGGATTRRIVCAASTGPLQDSVCGAHSHAGLPGPVCVNASVSKRMSRMSHPETTIVSCSIWADAAVASPDGPSAPLGSEGMGKSPFLT